MPERIFFQSSLPRSGSTLLQNILAQNPSMYATPTSGVLELLYAARANYSSSPEFRAQDSDLMKQGWLSFCRQGIEGFYQGVTDKRYVIDKSRGWGVHYGFLNSFYPNPKIVCMVRDLRAVFSSMEKNFRKHPERDSGMVNHQTMTGTTTEKRIDIWAGGQPVGLAVERLRQVFTEGNNKHMHFVRFEDLTQNPQHEMDRIYDFFGIDRYTHDFNNVEQVTKEDDQVYGIYGDHEIRSRVKPVENDFHKILGPHASNWIKDNYAWFFKEFNYY
jgi:sulfotransferase